MKHFVHFLKGSIALGLIGLLITQIDWENVGALLRGVDVRWLGAYVAIILIGNLISVWRWQPLTCVHGFKERIHTLFTLYITASFINNFLPGFIGGDAYRAYHLGRKKDHILPAAFSVIVDRAVGLFGILLLASVTAIALWNVDIQTEVFKLVVVFTFLLTFVVWLCMVWRYEIITFLARFLPKKYTHYAHYTRAYTTSVLRQSTLLGMLFGLIGVGLANYLLFVALGITVPFTLSLFFALLASVVSSVPLSIGNIGIKEWAYVTLFGIISIDPSVAVAVVILGRVMQALISTLGVPFYFMRERQVGKKHTQSLS